jgi:hypothetical protein
MEQEASDQRLCSPPVFLLRVALYSPKCVEEVFSEVRPPHSPGPTPMDTPGCDRLPSGII